MLNQSKKQNRPNCDCGSVDLYEEMLKQKGLKPDASADQILGLNNVQSVDSEVESIKSKKNASTIIQNINEK